MLESFKTFSEYYADGITAITAAGALLTSLITLLILRNDFSAKHRPYITPVVQSIKHATPLSFHFQILPKNVGPHPCFFKLSDIELHIGDEMHATPPIREWILLGSEQVSVSMPAGFINEAGIQKIREARYRKNRVELHFKMTTTPFNKKGSQFRPSFTR